MDSILNEKSCLKPLIKVRSLMSLHRLNTENTNIRLVPFTEARCKVVLEREKVSCLGQTEQGMTVNGAKDMLKETVYFFMRMEIFTMGLG